jgi:hypothetical protein
VYKYINIHIYIYIHIYIHIYMYHLPFNKLDCSNKFSAIGGGVISMILHPGTFFLIARIMFSRFCVYSLSGTWVAVYNNDDVYLNKLQRKVLKNLFSTWITQTSQYGISKENKSTDNKSYRYNRTTQRYNSKNITPAKKWDKSCCINMIMRIM